MLWNHKSGIIFIRHSLKASYVPGIMPGAENVMTNKFKITCTVTQSGSDRGRKSVIITWTEWKYGLARPQGEAGEERNWFVCCVRDVLGQSVKGWVGGQRWASQGESLWSHREPFSLHASLNICCVRKHSPAGTRWEAGRVQSSVEWAGWALPARQPCVTASSPAPRSRAPQREFVIRLTLCNNPSLILRISMVIRYLVGQVRNFKWQRPKESQSQEGARPCSPVGSPRPQRLPLSWRNRGRSPGPSDAAWELGGREEWGSPHSSGAKKSPMRPTHRGWPWVLP